MKYAIQCHDGLFAGYYIFQGEEYIVIANEYSKPKLYKSRKRAEKSLEKVNILTYGFNEFMPFENKIIEVELTSND